MRFPNGFGGVSKLSGNRRNPYIVRITTGWTDDAKQIIKILGYYPTRAEAIKALSAYATFTITDDNGASLQQCGICWSTTSNPTIADNKEIASGNEIGEEYLCMLSDLQPNTTYYVRAYAITSIATSYSSATSFTTPSGLPTISKSTSTTATATTYTITGNVTDNGGYAVTERGVCYSTTNNPPTVSDTKIVNGSGN